jgi:hypothetical protein
VAGSSSKKALREQHWGALVDGRRSGSNKPSSLPWRWSKRSLAPRTKPVKEAGGARGATESVRSPSPVSYAVDNAAARWRSPKGSPSGSSELARLAQARGRKDRSWDVPSSTPHSGPGRRKAGRHRGELGPSGDWEHRGRRRRKPSSLGNRTIAGARVVGRLQKSVRSIFLVP